MHFQFLKTLPVLAAILVMSSISSADSTVAEWNYNAVTSPGSASTGTGTTSGAFFPFSSALPLQDGSPADTNPVDVGGSPNNASAPRSGPQPGEDSGLRMFGVNTSLVGFETPTFTWDVLAGYRTSRYYQITGTTDGVNFAPVTGGVGSSVSGAFGSATVSSDGLVTIETIDGLIDMGDGVGYFNDMSFTFPAGYGYNDADFGVRIAAVWEPGGTDFVSSFAGTDSTDMVSGYIRNTSEGGSQARYDLVRITASAIPEPTSFVLAGLGLTLVGLKRRR